MPATKLTLSEFQATRIETIASVVMTGPHTVQLRTLRGAEYEIDNVHATIRRSSVTLTDDHHVVRLDIFRLRDQWVQLAFLAIGALGALLGLLSSIGGVGSRPKDHAFSEQLRQLDSIQQSLRDLDKYISEQQSGLRQLAQDVSRLQRERDTLAHLASLKKEQVQALLAFQSAEQHRQQVISIVLSFVVGVLSSLSATMLLRILRRTKKSAAQQSAT